MKSFSELTKLGKIRRLRQVVFKAIERYDLSVKKVKFLTIETNTMFQVWAENGEKYVLRIYSEEETTLKENQAEMFWLDALRQETTLKVVEPVKRADGQYLNVISVPGVPKDQRCVLFKWVPGKPLENYLSSENYNKFGQTLAKLHDNATSLKPLPSDIQPKKWDKVFYYPDEPVIYNTSEYAYLFPPERIEVIDKVIERANDVFARLFSNEDNQILIHGDLHFWNVHLYRGELIVIDFEDVNLGYPVQDIAVTLMYGRERDGYKEWRKAFQEGYSSIRMWPVDGEITIETLMAARVVMFINYVARIDPSPLEYVKSRTKNLEQYLKVFG
jgi:Ser/Thr protein kinase RdoA (MazF antagonist)